MNNSYVIQWKSKVNGRAGRGSKRFDKEEAERLVAELNNEYPQIEHQAVPANAEEPVPDTAEPTAETVVPEPESPMLSVA